MAHVHIHIQKRVLELLSNDIVTETEKDADCCDGQRPDDDVLLADWQADQQGNSDSKGQVLKYKFSSEPSDIFAYFKW